MKIVCMYILYEIFAHYFTGPPDAPAHITATDLSGLNIKVSWSLGRENGAKTTKVYIQARTLFDLDVWHTIKVSNKTTGDRSSEIVEMSPWIEFRIRVLSENKYGMSEPSEETSKWIRTPTDKPRKYPANIQGKGTGPSELTISYDVSLVNVLFQRSCQHSKTNLY